MISDSGGGNDAYLRYLYDFKMMSNISPAAGNVRNTTEDTSHAPKIYRRLQKKVPSTSATCILIETRLERHSNIFKS